MDDKLTITIPVSMAGSFYEMLETQREVTLSFAYMDKYGMNSTELADVIDNCLSQIDAAMEYR